MFRSQSTIPVGQDNLLLIGKAKFRSGRASGAFRRREGHSPASPFLDDLDPRFYRFGVLDTLMHGDSVEVVNVDCRFSDPPLGKCQDVAAPSADSHVWCARRL